MNGLPWFPLFCAEWLTGTAHLSLEAQGAYMRLLNLQWLQGPLPTDDRALERLLGVPTKVFKRLWQDLGGFFPTTPAGRANLKLEEIRRDQENRLAKLSKAGIASGEARRYRRIHQGGNNVPNDDPSSNEHRSSDVPSSVEQLEVEGEQRSITPEDLNAPINLNTLRPATPEKATAGLRPAGWNKQAAETIQRYCFTPDGTAPPGHNIARDLKWVAEQLDAGETLDRVFAGIRGAETVWPEKLRGQKWSPAKVFSKRGPWVDLYERAVTADGRRGRPRPISELLRQALQ